MAETTVTFLGTAAVLPGPGEDSACFLINGSVLFDCGWYAALRMQEYGFDPLGVETLFLTHCHHDHYMGLPALLFVRAMRQGRGEERPPLKIVGPADDLPVVTELARQFLQAGRFPSVWPPLTLHPLVPGESYETERFRIDTVRALHPVTGLCGRFTDRATGVAIAFSGDTGPNAELAALARGADLLIHEASVRPEVTDDALRPDHSRAADAARTALRAGVKRLALLHIHGGHHEASLAAARAVFPATELARQGETLRFGGA
jgi:ribonuclease Z